MKTHKFSFQELFVYLEEIAKLQSTAMIRKEAFDSNDNFLLLLFSDLIGIPNPFSYYALELVPYLNDELEAWERRMLNRKSILEEKFGQFDFCC